MFSQNNYDVGIYCRLSRDDNNGNQESMSISNQRDFLVDYVCKQGWNVKNVYADDGVSGTTFDRPDFQRMITDVKLGKINCVVAKDLSRIGRNYVQTGYYIDELFQELGVRFLAINDNVDTLNDSNDLAAFQHVINEIYPKQVSKKVRQVKHSGAEQGKFMGSQAAYGYLKSPEDKHKLIVDEYAASIVQTIYMAFLGGNSARQIGESLTRESVDSPKFYAFEKNNGQKPKNIEKNHWCSSTILSILRNQVYAGDMVQGKRQVISFKSKKRRAVDPTQWITVNDTHKAIIERKMWNEVQSRLLNNKRYVRKSKGKGKELHRVFSGCLICADCGSRLAFQSKPKDGAYRCSRYNNAGKTACSSHYILEKTLLELVLSDIQQYSQLAADDKSKIELKLLKVICHEKNFELRRIEEQKLTLEHRLEEINCNIKSLYEDKCKGTLTDSLFSSLSSSFLKEQSGIDERLKTVYGQLESQQDAQQSVDSFLNEIKTHIEIKVLNRQTVMTLIEKITIGEAYIENEERVQPITIEYRFIGNALTNTKEDIA